MIRILRTKARSRDGRVGPAAGVGQSAPDSPKTGLEWLADRTRILGRPLRVLHIGNIANNGYNNARIQRQHGIEADVLCYDYYHVMGCPEWEDADFRGAIQDHNHPDWTRVDLRGFVRPTWFVQGPLFLCQDYLIARAQRDETKARRCWTDLSVLNRTRRGRVRPSVLSARARVLRQRLVALSIHEDLPAIVDRRLARWTWLRRLTWQRRLARILALGGAHLAQGGARMAGRLGLLRDGGVCAAVESEEPANRHFDARAQRLVAAFQSHFPERADRLAAPDLEVYRYTLDRWEALFAHYDIIQGYSTDGIHPLLAGKSYCAFEHGTIRDIPFAADRQGRVCALVYREAAKVFLTNSDNLAAAARLGLNPDRVTCLPHPFDHRRVMDYVGVAKRGHPAPGWPVRFFSPSRQHWKNQQASWGKGNDLVIRAAALLLAEGLDFRVRFVEWGQEVDLSKALIAQLGCAQVFEWVPQMRKTALWDNYLDAHCVIDQLIIPAIGGVTFEAMALGRPVITRIDTPVLTRFFGEAPPVYSATTTEEVAAAMRAVIVDPGDRAERGPACARWILAYHSADRIVELQARAYRELVGDPQ